MFTALGYRLYTPTFWPRYQAANILTVCRKRTAISFNFPAMVIIRCVKRSRTPPVLTHWVILKRVGDRNQSFVVCFVADFSTVNVIIMSRRVLAFKHRKYCVPASDKRLLQLLSIMTRKYIRKSS